MAGSRVYHHLQRPCPEIIFANALDNGRSRIFVQNAIGGKGGHPLNTHAHHVWQTVSRLGGSNALGDARFFNGHNAHLDTRIFFHETSGHSFVGIYPFSFVIGCPKFYNNFFGRFGRHFHNAGYFYCLAFLYHSFSNNAGHFHRFCHGLFFCNHAGNFHSLRLAGSQNKAA